MKIFKRIQVMFLALVMCLGTVGGTTAFAAEIPEETVETIEFEITPNESNGEISLMATSNVDDTFNVYLDHTGSSRTYSGKYIRYSIEITDTNGNAVDNILAVRLYDSRGSLRSEGQFWANGAINAVQDIPVSSGQSYYFRYLLAYGTARLQG
mgnify:FL=1